jgi:outer membrane receptor protein involved in Fe transport
MNALWLAMAVAASEGEAAPPANVDEVTAEALNALSLEDLLRIELTAPARLAQTVREAPGLAAVVSASQLREWGWRSLNDILLAQPGFFLSQDYERTIVGARGMTEGWNANHMLLLVDGVPINDSESGAMYGSEITPLFFAGTVEVIRGPGSALYGSNAMNGVVAINTVDAERTLEGEHLDANARAFAYGGSAETLGGEVLTVTRGRYLTAFIGFAYHETDGNSYRSLDSSGRVDLDGQPLRLMTQDERTNSYVFAKVQGTGALEGLRLQYHLQQWQFEPGHGWSFWIPDERLPMLERRHILALSWQSRPESRLRQEYALRWQRRHLDLNMRYYPDGAFDGFYPNGVTEYSRYHMHDVMGRAALGGEILPGVDLLGGVCYGALYYDGDEEHWITADIDDAEGGYPPIEGKKQLGDIYEPITGRPVQRAAVFGQLVAARLLGLPLTATAGLRFDRSFFDYVAIDEPGRPVRSKSYQQLSPRLALVLRPTDSLAVKMQSGQAFRAPALVEMVAANTWSASSNLDRLEAETALTSELAVDWGVSRHFTFRADVFDNRFDNLIGYGSDNVVQNLYSRHTAGAELELLADVPLAAGMRLAGYASYSYTRLLDEEVSDSALTASPDRLAWAPEHVGKAGLVWHLGATSVALQTYVQGPVERRASDRATPEWAAQRPARLAPWARVDLVARQRVGWGLVVGLDARNLLDARGKVVNTRDAPFDYRIEGRRILATIELEL